MLHVNKYFIPKKKIAGKSMHMHLNGGKLTKYMYMNLTYSFREKYS